MPRREGPNSSAMTVHHRPVWVRHTYQAVATLTASTEVATIAKPNSTRIPSPRALMSPSSLPSPSGNHASCTTLRAAVRARNR